MKIFSSTCLITLSLLLAVFQHGSALALDDCGRPLSGSGRVTAADAALALRTAVGQDSCRSALCDVDGNQGLDAADAAYLLRRALNPNLPLHCPPADAPVCAHPVSAAETPSLGDARFIVNAAVGSRSCTGANCDVDASGNIDATDAALVHSVVSGHSADRICLVDPIESSRRLPRTVGRAAPGQGECTSAFVLTDCRIRQRLGGSLDRIKLRCDAVAPAGFPTGFDPSTELVTLTLRDTDSPCIESFVPVGLCEQRNLNYRCDAPTSTGGDFRIRFKAHRRRPNEFRVRAFVRESDLTCVDRLSSPWTLGLTVGDDCTEAPCPVAHQPVRCPGNCGNGSLEDGEQCDEGGATPSCDADCTFVVCGDNTLNLAAGEECDEGPESSTCTDDCIASECGDSIVNPAAGEQCDDGGESATCDADCTFVVCGDGNTNATAGESCDEGGTSPTCDGDCSDVLCGDSFVNFPSGEQCDEGGATENCSANCELTFCGDGIVQPTLSEDCDDAGESPSCNADCTTADCGDGKLNQSAGESCDGLDLGGETCTSQGHDSGVLGCDQFCDFDDSACMSAPPPFAFDCDVTISVPETEVLGALQYDVDYSGTPSGGFIGSADGVDCQHLVGDFGAHNDREAQSILSSAMISVSGFATPNDVARCGFETNHAGLSPADFSVTVVDQSRPDFSQASVTVSVSDVSCSGSPTTSTTTTTLSGPAGLYDVVFAVLDSQIYGSLQIDVDYSAAPGELLGNADLVDCTRLAGDFGAVNDDDSNHTLYFAAISVSGFASPTDILRCTFDATSTPSAGQFAITVVDASDTSLNPVLATVVVQSITPQ